MNASGRLKVILPLVSLAMAFAPSAYAQQQGNGAPNGQPPQHQGRPVQAKQLPPRPVGAAQVPQRPVGAAQFQQRPIGGAPGRGPDAHFARGGPMPMHNFGGHPYRGHLAWEGGRWHHEVHNGRDGWWWDVGGAWYYYPQPMDGPPTYISEDYADDVAYGNAPEADYAPPPGAYEPPPPPPAPDPGASAVGGAIVGGVLGGLLTGRASGAAAGAVIGGATGAIAGATAASRPGYYFAQGNCYYRYPNGQYVQADPRACY